MPFFDWCFGSPLGRAQQFMEESHRSIHDSLMIVKRCLKNSEVRYAPWYAYLYVVVMDLYATCATFFAFLLSGCSVGGH